MREGQSLQRKIAPIPSVGPPAAGIIQVPVPTASIVWAHPATGLNMPPWTSKRAQSAVVFAAFLVLTVALFRNAWLSPMHRWVGVAGDASQFAWFLRWFPHAVSHGQNPLLTDHINFPDGVNLMWNTSAPLAALVLSPVTLALGPVFAYNVFVTLGVTLSGWCAFLMLRRYVRSPVAAAVGALLYGFSPYVLSHARAHANLPAAFIPPLMFLVLDELLVRQRRSAWATGALLGGLAFVQLMVSSELLATEFVVATLGLLVLAALFPRHVLQRAEHAAIGLAIGATTATALSALPLLVMVAGRQHPRTGALWGPDIFVSDLVSFVIPRGHVLIQPAWTSDVTERLTDACCPAESGTYLGLPLLLLLTVIVARMWRRPIVRITGLIAVGAAVLSMGPHLHVTGVVTKQTLPFEVFTHLPIIDNMLAGRFMLYVYLMAAVLVAVALDALGPEPMRRRVGGVAVVFLALVPLVPQPTVVTSKESTPAFFRDGAKQIRKGSVVLVAPFARDTDTAEPMLWQAVADMRFRMPSGYAIGPDRDGRMSYLPIPTKLSTTMQEIQRGAAPLQLDGPMRAALASDMRDMQLDAVVVGPMRNRADMVRFFTGLLGRAPRRIGGVELWPDVQSLI